MASLRIAITGANGFIGRHLVALAAADALEVVGVVRSARAEEVVRRAGGRTLRVAGLDDPRVEVAFEGAQAVVHLAQIGAEAPGVSYDHVNVAGTRSVIAAASRCGVPRLVHLSGLGVASYGQARRCTNRYFLSKRLAESALFESGLETVIFRPSYVLGPGDGAVPALVAEMAAGEVALIGDGSYRVQPLAVRDAAACILAALRPSPTRHRVFDMIGPEALPWRALIERTGRIARRLGRSGEFRMREVTVREAEREARAGGYRGKGLEELDCLLCDEVADARPLEALLGRPLTPLDTALEAAVRSI